MMTYRSSLLINSASLHIESGVYFSCQIHILLGGLLNAWYLLRSGLMVVLNHFHPLGIQNGY